MGKTINVKFGRDVKVLSKEQLISLVRIGEKLGDEIIDIFIEYGGSFEALFIETYALAKVWGTLQAVARDADYDPTSFFEMILPVFIKGAEKYLEELKEEGKIN